MCQFLGQPFKKDSQKSPFYLLILYQYHSVPILNSSMVLISRSILIVLCSAIVGYLISLWFLGCKVGIHPLNIVAHHTAAATIVWKFVSHARSQVSSSYSVADEFRHVFGVTKWCQTKPWCDRNGILLHTGLNSAWQFRLPARFSVVWKWNM